MTTALSLFSGAGGMDLGVLRAGFEVCAAIELDPHCCETQRANIEREGRGTAVIEEDIREVAPEKLMQEMGWVPGELDLLFGGPPCQSFSQIGKQQGLEDERGLLLFEMPRFAKALRPKVVLIEQVKGLLSARGKSGRRGEILEQIIQDFKQLGYTVRWQVVNAAAYGVPQLRHRVFIMAFREGRGCPFPEVQHVAPAQINGLFGHPPFCTVGEALIGLGSPTPKGTECPDSHVDVTPAGDRFRINGVPEGSYLAAQTHLSEQVKNLTKKDTTKFLRLDRNAPAKTLRCGEVFFHPTEDRYITPREAMRLHGYPDDYLLKGPIRGRSGRVRNLDQYRQVANSVPPPVARILADSIRKVLSCP